MVLQAYTAGKPPTFTISTAGYGVVDDVKNHYRDELKEIAEPLGRKSLFILHNQNSDIKQLRDMGGDV